MLVTWGNYYNSDISTDPNPTSRGFRFEDKDIKSGEIGVLQISRPRSKPEPDLFESSPPLLTGNTHVDRMRQGELLNFTLQCDQIG